jgi:hypothetical protein
MNSSIRGHVSRPSLAMRLRRGPRVIDNSSADRQIDTQEGPRSTAHALPAFPQSCGISGQVSACLSAHTHGRISLGCSRAPKGAGRYPKHGRVFLRPAKSLLHSLQAFTPWPARPRAYSPPMVVLAVGFLAKQILAQRDVMLVNRRSANQTRDISGQPFLARIRKRSHSRVPLERS